MAIKEHQLFLVLVNDNNTGDNNDNNNDNNRKNDNNDNNNSNNDNDNNVLKMNAADVERKSLVVGSRTNTAETLGQKEGRKGLPKATHDVT